MAKRKADQDAQEQEQDQEMLDIDLDFFDFADVDYQAVGLLLRQLCSHDAVELDIPGLSNLVLEQKLGSTVKCDGKDSDPYAFCTLVNLRQSGNTAVRGLAEYLKERTSGHSSSRIHKLLENCLSPETAKAPEDSVALILNERLMNMPPHITAPFLRLLAEEVDERKKTDSNYTFTNLIFFSRVFVASGSSNDENIDMSEMPPTKTKKKSKKQSQSATAEPTFFDYHVEDGVIAEHATETIDFTFKNADSSHTQDSFGVDSKVRLLLVPYASLVTVIDALDKEGEA